MESPQTKKRIIEKTEVNNNNSKKIRDDFTTPIILNVGGIKYTTTFGTLLKQPNTYFTSRFSGQFDCDRQDDGSYFIDRNGKVFEYILEYLRSGELILPKLDQYTSKILMNEIDYYGLNISAEDSSSFQDSDLLTNEHKKLLIDWDGRTEKVWTRVYQASKQGYKPEKFHQLCDNKGPTYIIFRSTKGFIFGGYNPVSWKSANKPQFHRATFLFTLTNPHNIPPTKFEYKKNVFYEDGDCVTALDYNFLGPNFGCVSVPEYLSLKNFNEFHSKFVISFPPTNSISRLEFRNITNSNKLGDNDMRIIGEEIIKEWLNKILDFIFPRNENIFILTNSAKSLFDQFVISDIYLLKIH